MNKNAFLTIIICLLCTQISAQNKKKTTSAILSTYTQRADSIKAFFCAQMTSLTSDSAKAYRNSSTTLLSPYLYRITGPQVYYRSAVSDQLALDWNIPSYPNNTSCTDAMAQRDMLNSMISGLLVNKYLTSPSSIAYCDERFMQESLIGTVAITTPDKNDIAPITKKAEGIKDVKDIVNDIDIELEIKKPNFWKLGATVGLQLSQNYFSQNWYKGGNNNATLLSSIDAFANYNNQKNIQWDNRLELRLGFVTSASDSIHKFLTANDKIYLSSKLGIRAFKDFYYAASLEAQTQFMPGYKANDPVAYSMFLAPLDVFVSIGLDYKPKFKNVDLSVAMLPLSYRMRYINSGDKDILNAFKMPDDKRATHDFGSKLDVNLKWKLLKNLTWSSRLYYFTSYKLVEAEFENKFAFAFNKYFSTELYTLWRFDDNRDMKYWDSTLGFFQFKEYLTLGVTYAF